MKFLHQMITDTHTHLYSEQFNEDREAMIQRAKDAGVSRFFIPAIDSSYTKSMLDLEKENPNDLEFIVPPKLQRLINNKDYGQYADDNGELIVNFITNNDITGGNSGSPIINGKGQLIGTAFDGNWESMSGDIAFETKLQRTIGVDIRYVLLIIDKFAGASHLVEEMTLVK